MTEIRSGSFREAASDLRSTAMAKGFGCRQAYESLSCRNPRATVVGYGDFDLRSMPAMVVSLLGSAGMDAGRPLRCASARFRRPCTLLAAILLATIVTIRGVCPLPEAAR